MRFGGDPRRPRRDSRAMPVDERLGSAPPRRVRALGVVAVCLVLLVLTTACSRRKDTASPATSTPPNGESVTTSAAGAPGSVVPTSPPVATVQSAVTPKSSSVPMSLKTADGRERTYHVFVPSELPAGPVPLLVGLHGGFGSGEQFEQQSGFDGLAEANGFIAVYPDGIPIPVLNKGRVWNGGGCCPPAEADKENVDDVAFISAVIDEVGRQHKIDPARVFLTGHSNGGIMSYRLGCELADKVAAIGMQAGTLFVDSCQPSKPVPLIEIHGTADQNIPINGGVGDRALSRKDFPSPAASVQQWAKLNGCGPQPGEQVDTANSDVVYDLWTGCHDGASVQMVRVTGANHAWMGHEATKASEVLVGTPYLQFDSSLAIWTFLAAHPRR